MTGYTEYILMIISLMLIIIGVVIIHRRGRQKVELSSRLPKPLLIFVTGWSIGFAIGVIIRIIMKYN